MAKPNRDHFHEFVAYKPCGCWCLLMSVDLNDPDDLLEYAKSLKKIQNLGLQHEFVTPADWEVRGSEICGRHRCAECEPAPKQQEVLPGVTQ